MAMWNAAARTCRWSQVSIERPLVRDLDSLPPQHDIACHAALLEARRARALHCAGSVTPNAARISFYDPPKATSQACVYAAHGGKALPGGR